MVCGATAEQEKNLSKQRWSPSPHQPQPAVHQSPGRMRSGAGGKVQLPKGEGSMETVHWDQLTIAPAAALPFKYFTSKKALGHPHRSQSKIPANTAFPTDVLPTSCCHAPEAKICRCEVAKVAESRSCKQKAAPPPSEKPKSPGTASLERSK